MQKAHTARRRKEIQDWLREYKKSLKCSRCPEDHPATLDFHHVDPTEKEISVGLLYKTGWSQARIEAEIAKCEVLCSNCHRKHHWAV